MRRRPTGDDQTASGGRPVRGRRTARSRTHTQAPGRAAHATRPPTSAPIIRPSLHGGGPPVRLRELRTTLDVEPALGDLGASAPRRLHGVAGGRIDEGLGRGVPTGDPIPLVPDGAAPLEEVAR